MEIFEGLFALIDVASVLVDVVGLIIDLASSLGGDESRPR
jgi:hypothetical protein